MSRRRFIAWAIKRPGALTAAKKPGESTAGAAARLSGSGSTLQKQQANFYRNVLAPANARRKGGRRRARGRKRARASS